MGGAHEIVLGPHDLGRLRDAVALEEGEVNVLLLEEIGFSLAEVGDEIAKPVDGRGPRLPGCSVEQGVHLALEEGDLVGHVDVLFFLDMERMPVRHIERFLAHRCLEDLEVGAAELAHVVHRSSVLYRLLFHRGYLGLGETHHRPGELGLQILQVFSGVDPPYR